MMRSRLALVVLVAACVVAGAQAQHEVDADAAFETAVQKLRDGHAETAFGSLRSLAEDGHLRAQDAVAAMVLEGIGTNASVADAMGWYCLLAHQPAGGREVVHALWFLAEYFRTGGALPGSRYRDGNPARENPLKALFWFSLLARQDRYYESTLANGSRIGRLGVDAMKRQLFPREVEQVELTLADWSPRRVPADRERCLLLP